MYEKQQRGHNPGYDCLPFIKHSGAHSGPRQSARKSLLLPLRLSVLRPWAPLIRSPTPQPNRR